MIFNLKTILLSVCTFFIVSVHTPLIAKEIRSAKPEKHGFSTQRLDRITQFMNEQVSNGTMVGGYGLIARNGKIIYAQDYGFASRKLQNKINQDTIFRIYSMTKPIVSVALMMLYEEGKFLLDDPIAKYIPELANLHVAVTTADVQNQADDIKSSLNSMSKNSSVGKTRIAKVQPTIRDLLRHTAGFTYGIFGTTEVDKLYLKSNLMNASTLKEFVTKLGKLPLQYDPGSQWHYSIAVDVQGYLIEVLSGKKLSLFLEEKIFKPLDMKDTFFLIPSHKEHRLAELYQPENYNPKEGFLSRTIQKGLKVADSNQSARYYDTTTFEMGGAGLLSSTRDYLRFCQMLLNGGVLDGKRILSPKTIQLMTINQLKGVFSWFNEKMGFGLGFGVITDLTSINTTSSIDTYFWGGAAGTKFWIDPHENLIGIFMVQSLPHKTDLSTHFQNLSYQALIKSN